MTRVRLIDFETNNVRVVYDHFFKPPSPTMDYLVSQLIVIRAPPFFLAITPHLRALITPTTILLGHSLEPDLCTLLPTVHRYRLFFFGYSIAHVGARPSRDWQGLRAGGSVAPYRIVGPADTIHKRMRGPVRITAS